LTTPFPSIKVGSSMILFPFKAVRITCFAFFLTAFSVSLVCAQSDLGLSGGLESNHQTHFYKDPTKAFLVGFFPGVLIHGYGHFYAEDNLMGTTLLTGEVVSLLSIGTGLLFESDPNTFSGGLVGNASTTGSDLIVGGALLFGVTWIVDMAHAPTAADDYNHEFNLEPVAYIQNDHPTLAMACRF